MTDFATVKITGRTQNQIKEDVTAIISWQGDKDSHVYAIIGNNKTLLKPSKILKSIENGTLDQLIIDNVQESNRFQLKHFENGIFDYVYMGYDGVYKKDRRKAKNGGSNFTAKKKKRKRR